MSKARVFTLHLEDGYFIEQDMGGDMGKNVIKTIHLAPSIQRKLEMFDEAVEALKEIKNDKEEDSHERAENALWTASSFLKKLGEHNE